MQRATDILPRVEKEREEPPATPIRNRIADGLADSLRRGLERRLGMVRSATEWLQGLIVRAVDEVPGAEPGRDELERLRDEQLRLAELLERGLIWCGAQRGGRLARGTTCPDEGVVACLEALLAGPLADGDGWFVLADLAGELEAHALAAAYSRSALEIDAQRARVHRWLRRPRQDRGAATSR